MRQIGSAGTKPNVFGRMNEAGLEHHAAGDVLHQVGQMFAHKSIVVTQLIGQDNDVPVFSQGFCGAARSRVHGHGEVTKTHGVLISLKL